MQPIMHFEIHAANPERALRFYEDAFGWTATKWDGPMDYWMLSAKRDGHGIDGAILQRRGEDPANGAATNAYVCTINVDSLDTSMQTVRNAGGEIVVDKMEIPQVGWLAYAKDTEGNIFGMMQMTAA